jgi:hypothetical protein
MDHFIKICVSSGESPNRIAFCVCDKVVQKLDDKTLNERLSRPDEFQLWKISSLFTLIGGSARSKEPDKTLVLKLHMLASAIESLASNVHDTFSKGTLDMIIVSC